MEEYSAAELLRMFNSGMSWNEVGGATGLSSEAARKRASRHRDRIPSLNIPPSIPLNDEKPITIPGPANALIISDLHIPHHSPKMLERAVNTIRMYFSEIKTIIIAGDILDFSSISVHPKNEAQEEINESILLAGDVLRAILEPFDLCVIVSGNHDERVGKKLDHHWSLQLTINAALGKNWPECEMRVSNLDYCYAGDKWLIGHPSNYGSQGGVLPAQLADIYQRNVCSAHNHLIGMSQSKSGKFIGVDLGHMTLEDEHYYKFRRMNSFTRWNSGFAVLSNDYAYLFSEKFTDWSNYGL